MLLPRVLFLGIRVWISGFGSLGPSFWVRVSGSESLGLGLWVSRSGLVSGYLGIWVSGIWVSGSLVSGYLGIWVSGYLAWSLGLDLWVRVSEFGLGLGLWVWVSGFGSLGLAQGLGQVSILMIPAQGGWRQP
jgi:hypothetical protein